MARQNINTGTTANDGTGDSLRQAGNKINQNFQELYTMLGDSDVISPYLIIDSDAIIFNGDSINVHKTHLKVVDPTQTNVITFPDSSGTVSLTGSTQTLTNKSLDSAELKFPSIKDNDSSHNYEIVPGALTANQKLFMPALTDSDSFVFAKTAQTLTNKTLDSATANNIKVNQIVDNNGATITNYSTVGSAVNHIDISNEATSNNPSVYASGADTNVTLELGGKGNGGVELHSRMIAGNETLTSGGAVSKDKPLTIFNSGSGIAVTLADGDHIGEIKYFVNKGAGTATLTPVNLASGTTVAWTQHDAGFMIWTGTSWHLASKTQA